MSRLLDRPDVRAARSWLERHDEGTLALQRELAAIPAPTGDEARRAAFVAERMRGAGLRGVRTDAAGNVLARLAETAGVGIVIAAHLDTVFPAGTDVVPRGDGKRIVAPGIGDNARGLAAMLALAEACAACDVRVGRPVTFVATVGEEGHGDLRGARHLFDDPAFRPDAFIALDGPGMERVVHRALGTRRLRATYCGPGGHSWAAFGVANPATAVGLAATRIADLQLPGSPRTTASVVGIGGGSGLNVIPRSAWLELDLRSESDEALETVHASVARALTRSLESVNRRRAAGTAPLALEVAPLGQRPSGATDERHPVVQAALAATRALGHTPRLAAASTDANVAIGRSVPAIALGAGGKGGDAHLVTEWYENANGPDGIVRALLTMLAAAEAT